VVDVSVCDQNRARLESPRRNLTQDPLRLSPGIHHESRWLGISRDQIAVGLIGTHWEGNGGEECDGGS
jgi:hypothetical protein